MTGIAEFDQSRETPAALEDLGLGFLSWRALDVFEAALETYKPGRLFDHFAEVKVFFNEIGDEERAFADRQGLSYTGTPENSGILAGLKGAAEALSTEYIVLLENDLPLIEPASQVTRQLTIARNALARGDVVMMRLRSLRYPGQKFALIPKYRRYHDPGLIPALRRLLRPGKARRLIGGGLYVAESPHKKHKEIEYMPEGWWRVDARHLPWTNQSIMLKRSFFLDTIIPYAEKNASIRRGVQGKPTIEVEWNNPDWYRSGWKIGTTRGLFTHERI